MVSDETYLTVIAQRGFALLHGVGTMDNKQSYDQVFVGYHDREKIRRRKIIVINAIIIAAVLALLYVFTGYMKEGLVAAQAADVYSSVYKHAVSPVHDIDFSVVHAAGAPSQSWIYIPDTRIDYPLVQGENNDVYLDRDAYGNESYAGAIFINSEDSPDFSDSKTVIFGHNMADGSMFEQLHSYGNDKFSDTHRDMYIYTQDGYKKHYTLLCYFSLVTPSNEAIYIKDASMTPTMVANKLLLEADKKYDEPNGGNIVCLSTCTFHTKRTVVCFQYEGEENFDPDCMTRGMKNGGLVIGSAVSSGNSEDINGTEKGVVVSDEDAAVIDDADVPKAPAPNVTTVDNSISKEEADEIEQQRQDALKEKTEEKYGEGVRPGESSAAEPSDEDVDMATGISNKAVNSEGSATFENFPGNSSEGNNDDAGESVITLGTP